MIDKPFLRASGVSKSFGGVRVLDQVGLDLAPGEVHSLMGENGAGKSTLLKIIGGVYRADEGTMLLHDEPVEIPSPVVAQRLGISLIHQEPLVFPDLSVAENIYLGHRETLPLFRRVNWKKQFHEAKKTLDSLGVDLDPGARMGGLSIADQQMVEMAAALCRNSRILLMDEPTAALTPKEVDELFRIVHKLKADGKAVVFISHRLEEVFAISDRITVLRDGKLIGTRARKETGAEEIIRMMVGRSLEKLYEKASVKPGEPLLEVSDLSLRARFEGISFTVRAGEVLGFAGLVGAGRSDVANALFGIIPAGSGTIRVRDRTVAIRRPREAIDLGIALVPEDRQQQGLFTDFSIASNVTAAHLPALFPMKWILPSRETELVNARRAQLQIASRHARQPVFELSGGNQQKVVLAKWLVTEPDILILDEPTRGVDIGAKQEVHRLMGDLSRQGKAIVLISSDLPEVLALSDRIIVMREGRIAGRFERAEATPEKIMSAATGQAVTEQA